MAKGIIGRPFTFTALFTDATGTPIAVTTPTIGKPATKPRRPRLASTMPRMTAQTTGSLAHSGSGVLCPGSHR